MDEALNRYAHLSTYGENILTKRMKSDERRDEDEMLWIQYSNQYIKDEISDLSLIAFYI